MVGGDEAWEIGDDKKSLKGNQLPDDASADHFFPTSEMNSGPLTFGVVMNEWMNHAKRSTMWFHADISFFICPNIFLRDWIRLSGECSIMIWICVRGFVAASSTLAHTWVRKIYCFIEWLYGRISHTFDGGWDGDVMLAVAMVFFIARVFLEISRDECSCCACCGRKSHSFETSRFEWFRLKT